MPGPVLSSWCPLSGAGTGQTLPTKRTKDLVMAMVTEDVLKRTYLIQWEGNSHYQNHSTCTYIIFTKHYTYMYIT